MQIRLPKRKFHRNIYSDIQLTESCKSMDITGFIAASLVKHSRRVNVAL